MQKGGNMKKWDLFLSHASEDKEQVATPLADSLIRSGLKVWLDRFELKVGDSLRVKIDQGLAESRFGVVVLSESFLTKSWPKNELNGLFALEEDGTNVILPVWHGVDKATLARYSPILADRLAANTKNGIPSVARAIAEAVLDAERRSGVQRGDLALQLIEILQRGPNPTDVGTFLRNYQSVLRAALGQLNNHNCYYRLRSEQYGDAASDPEVRYLIVPTSCTWGSVDLFFCPANGTFFENEVACGPLKHAIEMIDRLLQWSAEHTRKERERYFLFGGTFHHPIILAGRRDVLSDRDKAAIRALYEQGTVVRSYDWLIEACAAVDGRNEEIAMAAAAKAVKIATWEEVAIRMEIDAGRRDEFFQAAVSLLESSRQSLISNLSVFVPRLFLHWHHAPDKSVAILKDLGEQAVVLALEDAPKLPADVIVSLLSLVRSLQIIAPPALDFVRQSLLAVHPAVQAEAVRAEYAGKLALALRKVERSSSAGEIASLIEVLADENDMARLKAIWAIGKIGANAAPAVPALSRCLNDDSRFVREAAQNAIAAISATTS
jgi:TIR domain/HEAT repeats